MCYSLFFKFSNLKVHFQKSEFSHTQKCQTFQKYVMFIFLKIKFFNVNNFEILTLKKINLKKTRNFKQKLKIFKVSYRNCLVVIYQSDALSGILHQREIIQREDFFKELM